MPRGFEVIQNYGTGVLQAVPSNKHPLQLHSMQRNLRYFHCRKTQVLQNGCMFIKA